jgi:hypothetical protein
MTERLQGRSESWKADVRRKQVVTAIVAAVVFVCVIVLSVYLTFGM